MSDLLVVENLSIGLPGEGRRLVENVSLTVNAGEIVGLVGESGSGKSLTAAAISGLLPSGVVIGQGRIRLQGRDIAMAGLPERRRLARTTIGHVFQSPLAALNPRLTIAAHLNEVIPPSRQRRERAVELLDSVGIADPARILLSFPHELSGGLAQRAMIAMAIANDPALLVADEPTTALDVTVQAKVLDLLDEIRSRLRLGILLISHDIGVISDRCDRIEVMRHGAILEAGSASEVLGAPRHPYTRELLAARPSQLQLKVPQRAEPDDAPVLTLHGITKVFAAPGVRHVALHPTSLVIERAACLGIVGESGSGKTTLARIISGLTLPDQGEVRLDGRPIDARRRGDRHHLWRSVQYVFQHATGALDPRLTVRETLDLVLEGVRRADPRTADTVDRLLDEVGLPNGIGGLLPGQLSGGQKQRVVIARALARRSRILIADEPVSALDLTVQARILELLARLRRERAMTLVVISHDLEVVRSLCDSVIVMAAGRIVEGQPTERLFAAPREPYTQRLIAAIPGTARHCRLTGRPFEQEESIS